MKSLLPKIFFPGVFVSVLIFSTNVLDATLLPRFAAFAFTTALIFIFLFKEKIDAEFKLPVVIYAAFCILNITGIFYAINKSEAIFETSRVLLGFLCFFLATHLIRSDRKLFLTNLQRMSVILVFTGAAIALWQSGNYDRQNRDALYVFTGISGHKNLFASFLFLSLFFLLLRTDGEKRHWKYFRIAAIIITIIILALIRTKAVYIGLITAGFVYVLFFLFSRKKREMNFTAIVAGWLLIINVLILFVAPKIIERTLSYNKELSTEEQSKKQLDNERLMLWHKTYSVFNKHKLLGVGPGNWQIHFPDETLKGMWRAEDLNFTFQRPHNDPLWILSETGFLGFNLYFLFVGMILAGLVKLLQDKNAERPNTTLLCISFIMGFFVISFFDFPKERMEHLIFLNILFAVASDKSKDRIFTRSFNLSSKYSVIGAILSIIILVVLAHRIRGEHHLKSLYEARYKGETGKVLKAGDKARSTFYTLDPTSLPLKWYTGNAHATNGNYDKAFSDFKEAYNENPFNRNVLNDLGSAYAMLNKNDSAKKLYLEVIRISPRFDDAKLNLAALYIREQNFKAADTCLQTLLHDSPRRTEYQSMINGLLGKQH